MSEFHVGEIAIFVRNGSPNYGKECEVVGPLEWIGGGPDYTTGGVAEHAYMHKIILDGELFCSRPEWLRKKQQKRDIDQLVSWNDCAWKPKRQTA